MPEDDNRIDRREERREPRTVWSQEFYDGRVRQTAVYNPGDRTVTLSEWRTADGEDGVRGLSSLINMEAADLQKIVKAIGG